MTSTSSPSIKHASRYGSKLSISFTRIFANPLLLFREPGSLNILCISTVTLGSILTPTSVSYTHLTLPTNREV